ncbi:hypothetical protein ACIBCM_14790 [Streptomyces sp. NPDC051018]|uniref:hypothetical protein n=1 Tax=Streptomyces sp. NPDC051018 TaxID=3365639 RepID=UPI0037A1C1BE
MDASVWIAALSGLVGTGIGAGASVWATVATQRHQARAAREQRQGELTSAAAETLLTELFAIQQKSHDAPDDMGPGGSGTEWHRALRRHTERAEAALLRMPSAELRQRVKETLDMAANWVEYSSGPTKIMWFTDWIEHLARESQELVGAYLRQEALPPRSDGVEQGRLMKHEKSSRMERLHAAYVQAQAEPQE